ncbi:hypothetical protein MMC14_000892 [Varicellaria rhodocarpa]|nr:hypothetical protein [Varicellaria rhodocarpa]
MAAPAVIISLLSIMYAYTTTTTITTTVTGTLGQALYLPFPVATTVAPLEYTMLPSPTNPASKLYPTPLPILTITQVENVVVDPSGRVIETATMVQATPPAGTTLPSGQEAGEKVFLEPPLSGWASRPEATKVGLIAGLALALVLVVVGVGTFIYWRRKHRRGRKQSGYAEGQAEDPAGIERAPRSQNTALPLGPVRNFSRPFPPSPSPHQTNAPRPYTQPPPSPARLQSSTQTAPHRPANLRGWSATGRREETRFPIGTPPSTRTTFVHVTSDQEGLREAVEAAMMHGGLGYDGATTQGSGPKARGKSPFEGGKVGAMNS